MTRTDPCNYFSSTSSSTCSTFSDSIAATPEEDADVLAFDLGLTTDAVGLGFGLLAYFLQPSPRHAQSRLEKNKPEVIWFVRVKQKRRKPKLAV